jgi:hypothetical protein
VARLAPKGCIVHRIELDGRGGADVGFRCTRDGFVETGQYTYHKGGGATGNYPSKKVKARSVRFRGVTVSGEASLGFVLSPASAVCHKRGTEIDCKLIGDRSSASLAGRRRSKKRRR